VPALLAGTAGVKLLGVDITNQLTSALGISKNRLRSPQANRNARRANADRLYGMAIAGDASALDQLWALSGRKDPTQGAANERDYFWQKYQEAKAYLEKNGPTGLAGTVEDVKKIGDNLTGALPEPVKKAVDDTAKALGTTSSTVTWVALALGVVMVIRSLRR
jgi:hypothetical protein